MSKRNLYRIIAVGVIVIIACLLFWIGRGHTLLIDNQEITVNGKSYEAAGRLNVTIDDQKPLLVKTGKRKKAKDPVAGPWHSIKVEVQDENKTVIKTVEKKFSVSLDEMFLLSIPALLADDPNWIQVFEPPKRK